MKSTYAYTIIELFCKKNLLNVMIKLCYLGLIIKKFIIGTSNFGKINK